MKIQDNNKETVTMIDWEFHNFRPFSVKIDGKKYTVHAKGYFQERLNDMYIQSVFEWMIYGKVDIDKLIKAVETQYPYTRIQRDSDTPYHSHNITYFNILGETYSNEEYGKMASIHYFRDKMNRMI